MPASTFFAVAHQHITERAVDAVPHGPAEALTGRHLTRHPSSYWGGDHSLFLGKVEYARQHPGAPLLFHGGRYERLGSSSSQ